MVNKQVNSEMLNKDIRETGSIPVPLKLTDKYCLKVDDSPNAGDPAEKHTFDSPTNHKLIQVEGSPEKKNGICVGHACESQAK